MREAAVNLRRTGEYSRWVSLVVALLLACGQRPATPAAPDRGDRQSIFSEDFESGTLQNWQDGVDSVRQRIVTDPASAQSGSRYLSVTYPPGRDGGWLTRFLMPGYDALYVSVYVRFPAGWQGPTKLVALYGSRTDDQWSGFGKAGVCPSGTDFFNAMLVTEPTGNPGPLRFYTYYPGMAREPDGTTCFGRYGNGAGAERGTILASYAPSVALSHEAWHHLEFSIALNTPGQSDGQQTFWVDGAQGANWSGLNLRSSPILRLNAVQLAFNSGATGVAREQRLDVDNVAVRSGPR
jgi:hypothetical protein